MSEKTISRTIAFMVTMLMLAAVSSPGMAETVWELPCNHRVAVQEDETQGAPAFEEVVYDTAYIGVERMHSHYDGDTPISRLIHHRVWAQFDISALALSKITGVGFKVYNNGSAANKEIASLRHTSFEPAANNGLILDGQHDYPPNLYTGGLGWELSPNAWNPETGFFEPDWDAHMRCDGAGNCRSLVDDLQAHVDAGKSWFAVGFSNDGDVTSSWYFLANLQHPEDPSRTDSIAMKVITEGILILLIPVNLGSGGEGGETTPMTCNSVNFATGNKYKQESDLLLTGPGLPLAYTRHCNSQSEHDGILGYGWTGTFSETVAVTDEGMTLTQADGADIHFTDEGSGKYVSVADRMRVIGSEGDGWRLTEPDRRILTFDGEGRLAQITDRNGNSQTVGHADGKLDHVEDNYGRRLDFTYNAAGRLETLTTPVGDFTYTYDGQGNLGSVTRPDQTQRLYHYEDPHDSHNLTQVTDGRGKSAVYEYDDQDRAVTSEAIGGSNRIRITYESATTRSLTDSEGNTTTYEIQGANGIGRVKSSSGSCGECPGTQGAEYKLDDRLRVSNRTDAKGNVTNLTHDDRGNLLTRKEAVGTTEERTVTHTWDPDHNRVASVARASVAKPGEETVRSFEYDTRGNLTEIGETGLSGADSVSRTVTMTYNDAGQMLTIDGPRADTADVVTFEYHPNDPSEGLNRGMLKKITDPLGHETLFDDYNGHGKPEKITDANGVETVLVHDSAGRVSSRAVAGHATSFEYDDAGNPTVVTLTGGRTITYAHNDSGLLETIEDNVGNYVKYAYDTRGNRTREEIRDESGVLRKYSDFAFDDLSRLERIIHPGDHSEAAGYDENDNLTRTADPNGNETLYDHDPLDRLTRITQPGSLLTGFVYDTHDNLVSVTDARSNATGYVHDDLGRAVSVDSPDAGVTTYEHDTADNLISRKDARGITVRYEYDALNRLTRIRFPDASQDISHGYDEGDHGKGRLTSMTDPAGETAYTYNALGQLTRETRVSDDVTYVTEYSYDPVTAELADMTYPSGMGVTCQRDGNGQITEISADGQSVAGDVSYLPFGPVAGMTFGDNVLTTERNYDERYLMTATTSGSVTDYRYTHDPAGNVLSISGVRMPPEVAMGTTLYGHAGNRLSGMGGIRRASYTYDGHGNTTSDGTRTFEYDQNNRLVKVTQDGVTLGEYFYDGYGRRVRKIALGIVTLYHYDYAGNLIAETDGNGSPLRDYIYLNGERVAMRIYGEQEGMYYFLNDHLGTPQKVADSAGSVVWEAAYLPFGEARVITGTVMNNFRLPGQYYDAETGLHYNWHRYYDPQTGRYLTPDPIGLEGGMNPYPYVEGNPVNLIDPDGQNPLAILAAIWTVIEFVLSASDAVTTAQTVADPCASKAEKASSVGLFVIGMVAPGGGYSTSGSKMIKHHIFNKFRGKSLKSQKYRDFFKKHEIKVDKYTVVIPDSMHKKEIHAAGKNWTTEWIDANPGATTKEVYQFGGELMDRYGLNDVPIVPYR